MIMECIDCHHLSETELAIKAGGVYECPACGKPSLIIRLDLQLSPDGRIIPCPESLGGAGNFSSLRLPEPGQDTPKKIQDRRQERK